MSLIAVSACGRIDFVPYGDCVLDVTAPATMNLNTEALVTTDGVGAVKLSTSGPGELDPNGTFFSPDHPAITTIEATDSRGCHGTASIESGGDSIFVAGGQDSGPTTVAAVLRSEDGIAWTQVGSLPGPRWTGKLIVFRDRLWFFGGGDGVSQFNETYVSDDGATWAVAGAMPAGATEVGMAVLHGRIWATTGSYANTNYDQAWSSDDGVTWRPEAAAPAAIHGTVCATLAERIWCVGGHDLVAGRIPIAFSTDGTTWRLDTPLVSAREEVALSVYADKLWFAGGIFTSSFMDTGWSVGGDAWTAGPPMPDARDTFSIVGLGGRMYLVGDQAQVYSTADFGAWQPEGVLPGRRRGAGVAVFTPR